MRKKLDLFKYFSALTNCSANRLLKNIFCGSLVLFWQKSKNPNLEKIFKMLNSSFESNPPKLKSTENEFSEIRIGRKSNNNSQKILLVPMK
jgi:hypothetical protein